MEFETPSNRAWQIGSLLMTVAIVGAGLMFALSAG